MSEILLSRTGDSATGDQHLIEYGAGNTSWIQDRNKAKKLLVQLPIIFLQRNVML